MTDVRAMTPQSLMKSFANGVGRQAAEANRFIDQIKTNLDSGEPLNQADLSRGEDLLRQLDNGLMASVHQAAVVVSNHNGQDVAQLERSLEKVETTADSLRLLLKRQGTSAPF